MARILRLHPRAAAPAPLNEPAPVRYCGQHAHALSTANNAANGGTTTGAYQLPDIVAPTTSPTVNTPTTTFNPTPRIPTTLVPNTPGAGQAILAALISSDKPGADATPEHWRVRWVQTWRRDPALRYRRQRHSLRRRWPVQPRQVQSALNAALYGPNAPYSQQQVIAVTHDDGARCRPDLNALTPDQQAWYNAQNAALNGYQSATGAAGASYSPPTGGLAGKHRL